MYKCLILTVWKQKVGTVHIYFQWQQISVCFYKNPKKPKADILIKALLNEEEVTMPLPKTSTPYYYKWNDFKTFYLKLLNNYKEPQ